MGSGEVNLSTEHQYWRVMRDFVEPAVRDIQQHMNTDESGMAIDHESLVLNPGAKYYGFDALYGNLPERWHFTYVLDCPNEQVRLEAVRPDHPYSESLPVSVRGVDDFSEETAREDILKGLEVVRQSGV